MEGLPHPDILRADDGPHELREDLVHDFRLQVEQAPQRLDPLFGMEEITGFLDLVKDTVRILQRRILLVPDEKLDGGIIICRIPFRGHEEVLIARPDIGILYSGDLVGVLEKIHTELPVDLEQIDIEIGLDILQLLHVHLQQVAHPFADVQVHRLDKTDDPLAFPSFAGLLDRNQGNVASIGISQCPAGKDLLLLGYLLLFRKDIIDKLQPSLRLAAEYRQRTELKDLLLFRLLDDLEIYRGIADADNPAGDILARLQVRMLAIFGKLHMDAVPVRHPVVRLGKGWDEFLHLEGIDLPFPVESPEQGSGIL